MSITPADVVITTAFLHPGDEVDTMLTSAGLRTAHHDLSTLTPEQRTMVLSQARAIIAGTVPLGEQEFALAPRLQVIVRTGVGYDSVDVAAASARNIAVCVTAGSNRQAVAEHVFALMLSAARRIPENTQDLAQGRWNQLTGRELHGATLGVLGLGSIGKAVARIATGFGMNVIAYDPYFDTEFARTHQIRQAGLDEVLRESDFVSLHLFLDESTRHLLDADRLALMKPDAILVNTARGGIVDENALVEAVRSGSIGGAAFDVFASEPLPADSPLRNTPGILATSHIAGATRQARGLSGHMAASNVIAVLAGQQPQHCVNAPQEAS
ncbi:MAG: phosphoglycerate dehydrogenase [Beutenbergiaceae bacterium]